MGGDMLCEQAPSLIEGLCTAGLCLFTGLFLCGFAIAGILRYQQRIKEDENRIVEEVRQAGSMFEDTLIPQKVSREEVEAILRRIKEKLGGIT